MDLGIADRFRAAGQRVRCECTQVHCERSLLMGGCVCRAAALGSCLRVVFMGAAMVMRGLKCASLQCEQYNQRLAVPLSPHKWKRNPPCWLCRRTTRQNQTASLHQRMCAV